MCRNNYNKYTLRIAACDTCRTKHTCILCSTTTSKVISRHTLHVHTIFRQQKNPHKTLALHFAAASCTFILHHHFKKIYKTINTNHLLGQTYHVSRLLNFLVTTLPRSMPRRSTMRCAKSGWDVPEKTLMLGILDCILRPLDFSKLSRTKLFARIGLADRTGITQSTKRCE